jgi:hypothetical protein
MDEGHSAIVADLGANLVCMLLILMTVAAARPRTDDVAKAPILMHRAMPLSGAAQSDLLYLRLRPDPSVLTVELTDAGAFAAGPKGLSLLTTLPVPPPDRLVAFVFSAKAHADLRRLTDAAGLSVDEITVPEALRHPEPAPGQSAFSPAFLGLPVGADAASIRPLLLNLLTQGGSGAAGAEVTSTGGWLPALWLSLRQAGNLALLWVAVLVLRTLRRRLPS